MNSKPARRSSLFLLELMIAILFFCLCTGYCVKMFVKAHEVSVHSEDLTRSVRKCSNLAEVFRNSADHEAAFSNEFPSGDWIDASTFQVCYDEDWLPCDAASAFYTIQAVLSQDTGNGEASGSAGKLVSCTVTASSSQEELYQICVETYEKGGGLS